jgi:integrase/recombinase XerD
VRQGKGAKDRLVPLSPTLLTQLRAHWRLYRPADWLFAGRTGAPLSTTSLQKAYTRAKAQAGVTKVGGIHALGMPMPPTNWPPVCRWSACSA